MLRLGKQGVGEVLLTLMFLIVVPTTFLFLGNPIVEHASLSRADRQVSLSYFVGARACDNGCTLRELKDAVDLSVVIPAFNEEKRLPIMLSKAVPFLNEWSSQENKTYEILVSDDHSTDGTVNYVLGVAETDSHYRLLSLGRNCGKGGAVRRGVQYARGHYILMVDADGATEISDMLKLWNSLQFLQRVDIDGRVMGMAVGSRAHLEKKSITTRSWIRTVLMRGFHFLVTILCTRNIRDTQCGFKLFTRRTARVLFTNLHLEGWTFDIDIIFMAEKLGIPISEVAVRWHEVEGSKLIQNKFDIIVTSIRMARDMLCLRIAHFAGIWKIYPRSD